jgi:CRISPR-associated RAMP protein (TIGR02581 family)
MFDTFINRYMFSGTMTARTALRIGGGRSTSITGTDMPVVRDAIGKPFIPGSSLKGVLRSTVESLVRGMNGMVCNPLIKKDNKCMEDAGERKDSEIESDSCLVCQVFGSVNIASKVKIRDLHVIESLWFGQFEVRNGVAIDRDTETAADQKLYDFEVVPAGTQFDCELVIENASDWQMGLLESGLRFFEMGEAEIGGGRSRGLGRVQIEWNIRNSIDAGTLLDYLDGKDGAAVNITSADVEKWRKALRAKLEENPNA